VGDDKVGKGKAEIRDKKVDEVIKHWNTLVMGLIGAQEAWKKYSKARLETPMRVEEFPIETQKVLNFANPNGDFAFLVEDIFTRAELESALKELLIK
jgi:hypothetical protein